MTRHLTRDRMAVLAALAGPLAAAAVLLPFRASWSNTNVALLLVVVVVAVAATGNRLAGAVAAVWAAARFDFFFTLPYYRLEIRGSASATTAVLLLVTGLVVSQLAARARRLQVIAITDAGYLAQIRETASLATTARSPDTVVDRVREQLTAVLGLEGCRFEYGSLLGHPPRLEPDGTITAGRGRRYVEEQGLPAEQIELRAFSSGQYYGRFMLKPRPGSAPARPPGACPDVPGPAATSRRDGCRRASPPGGRPHHSPAYDRPRTRPGSDCRNPRRVDHRQRESRQRGPP